MKNSKGGAPFGNKNAKGKGSAKKRAIVGGIGLGGVGLGAAAGALVGGPAGAGVGAALGSALFRGNLYYMGTGRHLTGVTEADIAMAKKAQAQAKGRLLPFKIK
jgi:hypothetical protein